MGNNVGAKLEGLIAFTLHVFIMFTIVLSCHVGGDGEQRIYIMKIVLFYNIEKPICYILVYESHGMLTVMTGLIMPFLSNHTFL